MTSERLRRVTGGWPALTGELLLGACSIAVMGYGIWGVANRELSNFSGAAVLISGVVLVASTVFLAFGFFTQQPNESHALLLFGRYVGTTRQEGFLWANPFYSRVRVSLRTRNFETQRLKVNERNGNPIEIAAVVVWHVRDTGQALFDVDRYLDYVSIQSESAVRHIATHYAYDNGEEGEMTLRSSGDEVSEALCDELRLRLAKAGVEVEETRLTHLAYAPEIASAMLRRQQAEAIIAARQKIVQGAVSMVEMALEELDRGKAVELDEERKASMVSNLLVVLCSESETKPVINAGTLYG